MDSAYLIDLAKRKALPPWVEQPGDENYVCVLCGNQVREQYAPICTGPHPSLDEHEPLMMERLPNG